MLPRVILIYANATASIEMLMTFSRRVSIVIYSLCAYHPYSSVALTVPDAISYFPHSYMPSGRMGMKFQEVRLYCALSTLYIKDISQAPISLSGCLF